MSVNSFRRQKLNLFRIVLSAACFAAFIYMLISAEDIMSYNGLDGDTRMKYTAAAIAGAVLMLLLSFLFIRKPLKNIIYSVQYARGKITYEPPKPEKKLEAEEPFEGGVNDMGYFYVGYDEEKSSEYKQ